MVILINILLTILMTWFTVEIYTTIPKSGFMILLIFTGWNIVFWLISFLYNQEAFDKTKSMVGLVLFFLKEVLLASLKVAYDVITPKDHMRPAIIAVPLDVKTDWEITLLANFITLTPGTLSIDISEDKKTLFIHEVYVKDGDSERMRQMIKNGFERRILELTR